MPAAPAVPGVKIGKPYEVFGRSYVPADDRSYDAKGIASWYGPTFHAKPTANGEIYDQMALTAAHKTLPMPSWVEVTNLDNGRSLTVRINDRGPFVDGRIIDLSRPSAELLGVDRPGLAQVRVKRVFPPEDWARAAPPPTAVAAVVARPPVAGAPVVPPVAAEPAVPPVAAEPAVPPVAAVPAVPPVAGAPVAAPVAAAPVPAPVPAVPVAVPGGRFIQVAALSDEGRARALASVLADFGPAAAEPGPGGLWRVRLGPVAEADLERLLGDVQAAGWPDARTVR